MSHAQRSENKEYNICDTENHDIALLQFLGNARRFSFLAMLLVLSL